MPRLLTNRYYIELQGFHFGENFVVNMDGGGNWLCLWVS